MGERKIIQVGTGDSLEDQSECCGREPDQTAAVARKSRYDHQKRVVVSAKRKPDNAPLSRSGRTVTRESLEPSET